MIIGLSGYARAGKSEAAKALVESGWEVKAFADKLREFLYTLNPMVMPGVQPAFGADYRPSNLRDIIDIYGWDGYKNTPYNNEIRRLIQTLGTECGRNLIGDNVWVAATLDRYPYSVKSDNLDMANWVIQDVRFINEAQAIKNYGGKIIRITKPGVGPVNNHPSETALDSWPWDHIIENDGTIEDLYNAIKRIGRMYDGSERRVMSY